MTIFVNSDTRGIVQGMTGAEGRKHTQRMLTSGTAVVGGVTPGKGGQSVPAGVGQPSMLIDALTVGGTAA